MPDNLTFDALKEKQRAIRAGFPETMGLRVHRAISWIGRAEASGGMMTHASSFFGLLLTRPMLTSAISNPFHRASARISSNFSVT